MLAKKTSKNQITLPKEAVQKFPGIDYFEVSIEEDKIELKPVQIASAGASLKKIRQKVAALGLTEEDVKDAIQWARKKGS
jgi:hypothetical protein